MKSVNRVLIASFLLVLLLVSTVFMPVVEAETYLPFRVPDKALVYLKADRYIPLFGVKTSAVTNLKSSNKNVATVSLRKLGKKDTWVVINGHKNGSANISFDVKYKGKTYSYKCAVSVRKYKNPFKFVKIGNLSMKQYLDKARVSEAINAHVPLKKALKNEKLSFQLNNGWKLKEIFMLPKSKIVSNGQKLTVKKGYEIDFWITDPKGYDLWFYFFFD